MENELVTIEIGSLQGPRYKSIQQLSWEGIPPFAILTGRNGSGKSQLLEFLALRLTGAARHQSQEAQSLSLRVTGLDVSPDKVVYIPSNWSMGGIPQVSFAELQNARTGYAHQYVQQSAGDINHQRHRAKLLRILGPDVHRKQPNELGIALKDDFSFLIDEANVSSALAHIFVAFRLKILKALEEGRSESDVVRQHGRPPWEVLNEILRAADFEYSVNSPVGTDLLSPFVVQLTSTRGDIVDAHNLSSGEQSILQVVLWLYYSQHHSEFPKVMLLDEPDAHLHPAMARQFLNVLHDVLVKKYGVRIILATHSPSTVAFAPEGSVFEMKRGSPAIRASPSKQYAIGLLTSGLLTVGEGTRFCFVEDHDDVGFYGAVRDVLTDFGPNKDPASIAPAPSIVFLPVCAGKGNGKVGGGCKVVAEWVRRFSGSGLSDAFRGIVDWDGRNEASGGVLVLPRYSFENYLLDPILIFVASLGTTRPIECEAISLQIGDEHLLKTFDSEHLQALADAVLSKFLRALPNLSSEDGEMRQVKFTAGVVLNYPRWLLEMRGKDLLQRARDAFGPHVVREGLLTALRRVRLVPIELAQLLMKLQDRSLGGG
jgi:predicted ATPase